MHSHCSNLMRSWQSSAMVLDEAASPFNLFIHSISSVIHTSNSVYGVIHKKVHNIGVHCGKSTLLALHTFLLHIQNLRMYHQQG